MAKASDIYTLYLKPAHLPTQGAREATIERAEVKEIHPRPGQKKTVIILSFVGKVHKLILNQGNANRLAIIAGDDLEGWPGIVVSLRRDMWGDKPTVIVEAYKNGNGKENGK